MRNETQTRRRENVTERDIGVAIDESQKSCSEVKMLLERRKSLDSSLFSFFVFFLQCVVDLVVIETDWVQQLRK